MKIIKVMIAEDEAFAREELEYLLQQEENVTIVATVSNGQELLDVYKSYQPDVLFLDIEMPGLRGTEVAKRLLQEPSSPYIIFTTAYEEYALEAFGVHAIDYLLKPYDIDRLRKAVARVRKLLDKQTSEGDKEQDRRITNLLVEDGDKLVVIKPESIYYAAKEDRSVLIYTDTRIIQTKLSLQDLEDKLVGYTFIRSHRSYLVNLAYVKEIETWFNGTYNIILQGKEDTKIPVSRAAAKDVLQRLQM